MTIQSIADHKRIPKKFLEVILLTLRDAGIIGSKRGKEGGYYMVKKLEEVTLADIMRLTDKSLVFLTCLQEDSATCQHCQHAGTCTIQHSFCEIQTSVTSLFTKKKLADVIEGKLVVNS